MACPPAPILLDVLDLGPVRMTEVLYPPGTRLDEHAHGYANVTLVVQGSLWERSATTETAARAWDLVVKPAGTPHSNVVGELGARTFSLCVPATGTPGYGWSTGGASARALGAFYLAFRTRGTSPTRNGSTRELGRLGRRLAATTFARTVAPPPARAPSWLEEACAWIARHADLPITLAKLGARFGRHPIYVARAFRTHCGCTVGEFVRRHRVRAATELLARPDTGLGAIAQQAGFADQAHLTRTFRRLTGLTPGRFRALVSPEQAGSSGSRRDGRRLHTGADEPDR